MHKIILVAAMAAAAGAAPAFAQSATDQMPVTVTIEDNCTVAATTMNFGTQAVLGGAAVDSTADIDLTCTPGASYDVSMDVGNNGTGGVDGQRNLSNGTDTIPYNLYSDAGYSSVWNTTATASGTAPASGLVSLTAYGRIPATAAAVPAGTYSDSVTVEVTF